MEQEIEQLHGPESGCPVDDCKKCDEVSNSY